MEPRVLFWDGTRGVGQPTWRPQQRRTADWPAAGAMLVGLVFVVTTLRINAAVLDFPV